MSVWEYLSSDKGSLALAGIAGAAVSAAMEWEGAWKALRRVFVGFMAALYIGPLGLPLFAYAAGLTDLPKEHMLPTGGFLVGVGGMFIAEFIIKVWKNMGDKGGKGDND